MEAVAIAHTRDSSEQGPLVVVVRQHVIYAGYAPQIGPVELESTKKHRCDHESWDPRPRVFVMIPVFNVQRVVPADGANTR